MCGIAGYFGSRVLDNQRIQDCLAEMQRRGPDSSGVFHATHRGRQVYLLNSRLSIVDLDPRANLPMQAGRTSLAYNGELYNYRELKRDLEARAHAFRTASDAEVLLHVIDEWGWDALDRCEGMWAAAVYDAGDGSLTLTRDRFGEKPLYVKRADDGLYFGSEPKFIAALSGSRLKANRNQLRRYLVNGYKSIYKQPSTFFAGLDELPPATIARIDADGNESSRQYWAPRFCPDSDMSYDEAVGGVRAALVRSVEWRLRADVPLAFCMSGGLDSNAIIAVASRLCGYDVHGFTVLSSDPRYDERELVAQSVQALGIRHTAVPSDTQGFLEGLRELVRYHDAPVYTITYFAQWRLMAAIASAGYRVSVSGTAADELLTGYYDHHLAYLAVVHEDRAAHSSALDAWSRQIKPFVRNPFLGDPDLFVNEPGFRDHIYLGAAEFSSRLTEPWSEAFSEVTFTGDLLRNRMLNELTQEAVPVILHEDDLNAMYFSIENRSPYLDRSLVEFCYRIPSRHLIRHGLAKAVLRDTVRDLLPTAIVDNPRKVGFNASILEYLDTADPDTRRLVLGDSPVWDVVRRDAVASMIDRRALSNSESKFLFNVLNCKMFLEMN
jgi:asparagine synthase (glutamine-hydrolysing)